VTRAVVFAYHDVGCRCLEVLLDRNVEVSLVVTHADDPKENLWFGSVAALSRARGIGTATPEDPNADDFVAKVRGLAPDFLLLVLLPPDARAPAPRDSEARCFQHARFSASEIPRPRARELGRAHGETRTGATLHEMVEKPDAGRIVDQEALLSCPTTGRSRCSAK